MGDDEIRRTARTHRPLLSPERNETVTLCKGCTQVAGYPAQHMAGCWNIKAPILITKYLVEITSEITSEITKEVKAAAQGRQSVEHLRELSANATQGDWIRSKHCFQIITADEMNSVTELKCPRGLATYPSEDRVARHKADVQFMVACVNHVRAAIAALAAPSATEKGQAAAQGKKEEAMSEQGLKYLSCGCIVSDVGCVPFMCKEHREQLRIVGDLLFNKREEAAPSATEKGQSQDSAQDDDKTKLWLIVKRLDDDIHYNYDDAVRDVKAAFGGTEKSKDPDSSDASKPPDGRSPNV